MYSMAALAHHRPPQTDSVARSERTATVEAHRRCKRRGQVVLPQSAFEGSVGLVYDCLYLAHAEAEAVPPVTADARLSQRAGDAYPKVV